MEQAPHKGRESRRAVARALALESCEATLAGLLEATVAMSALAQEPERWEAFLWRLLSG